MSMEDVAIRVENLSKVYKLYNRPIDRLKESLHPLKKKYHSDFYALDNISFSVKKGEIVGIIGKNGSGKSTLLKIITGVLTQNSGNIDINGRVSALLELGTGFNPEFTGIENIYLNGTMHGYSKEEMALKVNSILDFADIGEFINQPVKNYSSGMFARLAFAVAINIEPDILIIDEALSVGDIFFQNKCFRKFDELIEKNTTILFVSHDLGSVKQMCSRVLWLDEGKQIMFGEKDTVCSEYFNKQFAEMNMLNNNIVSKIDYDSINVDINRNTILEYPRLEIPSNSLISEDAEIISFFIKDSMGRITNGLEVHKDYHCHLVGKINKDIKNLIFGFVWENNKGVQLFAFNTYLKNNTNFNALNGEVIEAVFKFRLPKVMKGEYLLSPAIAEGNQKTHVMLTWLTNAYKVYVNNDGYNLSIIELDAEISLFKYEEKSIILS